MFNPAKYSGIDRPDWPLEPAATRELSKVGQNLANYDAMSIFVKESPHAAKPLYANKLLTTQRHKRPLSLFRCWMWQARLYSAAIARRDSSQ